MDHPLFKVLVLVTCMLVFWYYGAPPPSIQEMVASATDTTEGTQRESTVSFGSEVSLESLAYPGKVTIVDFYSQYCPPCRAISPAIHAAVKANKATALRVVDINRPNTQGIDWSSPVVAQHGIRSIPYFVIFDSRGNEVARGPRAKDMVAEFLNKRS